MRLKELTEKLAEVLDFKYLTYGYGGICILWKAKPYYDKVARGWMGDECSMMVIRGFRFKEVPDLSEFRTKTGQIDFSKCIVEVGK